MKKIFYILFLFNSCLVFGQTYPSSCEVPSLLRSTYEWDIKNLALRRMFEVQSPDTALVAIPQAWQDTILNGMGAILQAMAMPQRDTIFNAYCIHDRAPGMVFVDQQIMVSVDTTYAWTHQWQNMITQTGNSQIDSLLAKYDLHLLNFYNWSFASVAVLGTDSLWNTYALMDSIAQVPGVIYCEPNSMIGTAGRINYSISGGNRYYDFVFEWSDCFDGCDNSATWHFRVLPDCAVEFLGRSDFGFFGIQPLPPPQNCNLFLPGSITEPGDADEVRLYPNPGDGRISLNFKGTSKGDHTLKVYSLAGDLLYQTSFTGNDISLDLRCLKPGYYVYRLEDPRYSFTGKLVISK